MPGRMDSGVEPAELEHQQPDLTAERLTGFQERADEQLGVEEVVVRLPRLHSETRQVGEPLQRDVVGHFEGEEKVSRHLLDQTVEILGGRELVVSSIHADGFEDLGILNEAVPLESGFGELSPVVVALFVVNLSTPAFVFPTRCANEDFAGGETLNRRLQLGFEAGRLNGIEEVSHQPCSTSDSFLLPSGFAQG